MPCDYKGKWDCWYTHKDGTPIHNPQFTINISDVQGSNACLVELNVINDRDGCTQESFTALPQGNALTGTVNHTSCNYTFTLQFNADKTALVSPSFSKRTYPVEPPQPTDMGTITGTKG